MAVAKLGKGTVEQLLPKSKPYFVFDDSLAGFGVRVWPTGAKSWILEYQAGASERAARKRRVTLGSTTLLTPDEARKAAQAELTKGTDAAEAMRLGKRTVDQLEPKSMPYFVFDDSLTGFGVRVGPTGAKSWIIEYRAGAGGRTARKRRVTLGSTALLTPDQARKAAQAELAKVRLGADPAEAKRAERTVPTVAELINAYMTEEVRPKRAPKTAALYDLYFKKHVVPVLGTHKASTVSHADVGRLHREIGRDHPVTANRVVKTLSGAFTYASKTGRTSQGFNPTKGIEPFAEQPRDRYLTTAEMRRLGASLREAETVGLVWQIDPTKPGSKHAPREKNRREIYSPHVTGAIRLLLFTGCRLREILNLRWKDVDTERGLLFLPTSKTGKKTVVLNGPALQVLGALPDASEFVIAGNDPEKPRTDLKRPWSMISRAADLQGIRLHDLRHTHASIGAGASLGLPVIGKLLGHKQASTTQRYAHLDADPLRRASNTIGSAIASAMGEARSTSNRARGSRRRGDR